ncbi:MAG: nicotinate phosphoribosyltransferase [Candidatus Doudnabacteria bacterium]|nr:nicotinate phosphoribosyltransferase [Candidatus Doudnabacteria bacterium]
MRNISRVADEPIITSLLDVDFYKFTMGQLIFLLHPNVPVRFTFKNRTKGVNLFEHVDLGELREQLEHVRTLSFNNSDLHYLRGTNEYGEQRMFREEYLQFLSKLKLPEFDLRVEGGDLALDFYGPWAEVTYWETISLSIKNELYYRSLMNKLSSFQRTVHYAEGRIRLFSKIQKILNRDNSLKPWEGRIVCSEFGTRRRFAKAWQDEVIEALAEEIPRDQLRGTSNAYFAQKYGLLPMGSNAHELPMAYSGIYYDADGEDYLYSQKKVLEDWENLYGLELSIALSDTFGSDYFFDRVFTQSQYETWKGSRQDSGDPIQYGEKRIENYIDHGVDPTKKMILFSDGLDIDKIIQIQRRFANRLVPTFGWGTDLTNDLGFDPLSLVVKVTKAAGHDVAKLSDNIEKAMGEPEAIERMKKLVGYKVAYSEACRY